ncbi:MAG TPA: hypothetical protein VFJ82_04150 [Longimicrobium sp.]|nr:hypothetical protein [Longimicrobium sp.]
MMRHAAAGGRVRRVARMALCGAALLAGTAWAGTAAAQKREPKPATPCNPRPPEPGRPAPVDTARPPFREYGGIFMPDPGHVGLLVGIRAYGPMRHSGYVGAIRAPHGDHLGYTAELEAGAGGVQLAAGRGATGTARLQVNVLRTWGDPMWVAPNQTFVGAELRIGIVIGFGLVGYRRVQGDAPGDAWAGGLTGVVGI